MVEGSTGVAYPDGGFCDFRVFIPGKMIKSYDE
jgi:hypothetical protein